MQIIKSIRNIIVIIIFSNLLSCLLVQATKKPIVVVIPSYNNAQWCKRNLQSVFMQHYTNYRVIYIDDCSNDGTYELVEQYVRECQQEKRVLLLRNNERRGALANHYKAVHLCDDNEIVFNIDGDDWLKHEYVFTRINKVYSDPNVWLTYGSYENYPSGRPGECSRPMPDGVRIYNAYREHTYITSHLRTFYAGLFKQIKLGDFLYDGQFIQASCDTAFMFPMLEMASERVKYLNEVFYVYNQSSPHNHFRKGVLKQLHMVHINRARPKYKRLEQLPVMNRQHHASQKIDIIILSENNAQQAEQLLTAINSFITNNGSTQVIYQADDVHNNSYQQLQDKFFYVNWHKTNAQNFKSTIVEAINASPHDYVTVVQDNIKINSPIDFSYCAQLMQQSHAFGFFLSLGKNIMNNKQLVRKQQQPPVVLLEDDVYAWKFKDGEFDWRLIHNVNMTLYHKNNVSHYLQDILFSSITELAMAWDKCAIDSEDVGLFFKQAKVHIIETQNNEKYPPQILRLDKDNFCPCVEMMQLDY